MARTRRIKSEAVGTAYYHLMSRTNDKRFLFDGGRAKTQLVDALKRAAAFSGVEIDAYVAMDNHFHVVCKVVRPEEPVPEDELIRRVAALKGGQAADDLASHWKELREMGSETSSDRGMFTRILWRRWASRRTAGSSQRRPRHEHVAQTPCKKGLPWGLSPNVLTRSVYEVYSCG